MTDPKIIKSIFEQGDICRIGLINNGLAYIVPMNFGYEDGYIYFHSAVEGKKIEILKDNPLVSFEIDIEHTIRKGSSACHWGASYLSVMGSGNVEFISEPGEKKRGLNIIMRKYSGKNDWTFSGTELEKTLVFRILTEHISCKVSK